MFKACIEARFSALQPQNGEHNLQDTEDAPSLLELYNGLVSF